MFSGFSSLPISFNWAANPHNAYDCESTSCEGFRLVKPSPDSDKETQKTDYEKWRAERSDLAAQWETADRTRLAFRAATLGVWLLVWTIWETKATARLAGDTLEQAKENSKRELRAYLSTFVTAKNILDSKRRVPTLIIKFVNNGVTPAINPECHVIGMGADEHISCNTTIQPGETYEFEWPLEGFDMKAKEHAEEFRVNFSYSDIFNGKRWVKTEFIVSTSSFPRTNAISGGGFSASGALNKESTLINPNHIPERRVQFRSYRDDLQKEAKEYGDAKKA